MSVINPTTNDGYEAMVNRKGIFGFGFSANSNLDLMNLVVLAIAGIVVKIFFEEKIVCVNFLFNNSLAKHGPADITKFFLPVIFFLF